MINLAVINLKDILKNLLKLCGIGVMLFFIINRIPKIQFNKNIIEVQFLEKCFNIVLPMIEVYSNEEIVSNSDIISLSNILELEMPIFKYLEENTIARTEVVENIISSEKNNNIIEEIPETAKTEVITDKNLTENSTNEYIGVKIKNQTNYELTEEILNPDISLNCKDILIFHTHTCESYTSSEGYSYVPTGNYRTTDLNFTVARVGDELENRLKGYGYNVLHDKSYHDYPAYSGSYNRSLKTVQNMLNSNQNAEIVFDIHRDAIGNGDTYGPTVKIGDEYAAQLLFVIGTNAGGLSHDNWQQNLKFAIKVQQKANEMYPGLFKPILLTNSRYNQHVTKAANILEVGATGNTLEQALVSMKYLAKVLSEVI
ncbi:MAG: stage II sporulation protein P [Clostridia bacterium]|nr:stage II sporulation protein P [Clostridia bacterium]